MVPWRSKVYNPVPRAEEQKARAQLFESSHARGYDAEWRKARAEHLKREPLCRECAREGVVMRGEEVDHVVPHRGDMSLFWDPSNWQSLCKRHHSTKTAREVNARRRK